MGGNWRLYTGDEPPLWGELARWLAACVSRRTSASSVATVGRSPSALLLHATNPQNKGGAIHVQIARCLHHRGRPDRGRPCDACVRPVRPAPQQPQVLQYQGPLAGGEPAARQP